jgi:asparagine synthase (glutamine-hydrolysing)
MCGFTGFFSDNAGSFGLETLERMAEAIAHRGPDDQGLWLDAEAGIALGHRRLAIVDLSQAGHQPMQSDSGRYVFVFNGEIYNHATMRAEIEARGGAPTWRGHSDTETLLAGFEVWGIVETLGRAIGMFAFALFDRKLRTLTLGRDRLGEKPIYYGWSKGVFLFGSELKALRCHPAFGGEINRNALATFLKYQYVPGPESIYSGIRKLQPGCVLTLSLAQREPVIETYWSAIEQAQLGVKNRFSGSPDEAVDALESLLGDAIGQQMMADVPVGAFLSGGIDSSTVVALMQKRSARPVRSFAIGFDVPGFNEAIYAGEVARHLGTEHTELYVTPQAALELVPRLPEFYDEPFADSSQIPTYLVAQLARRQVTVSLSGDAGDELFAGYNTYAMAERFERIAASMPGFFRQFLAGGMEALGEPFATFAGRPALARQMRLAAHVLRGRGLSERADRLQTHWQRGEGLVLGVPHALAPFDLATAEFANFTTVEKLMARDLVHYLPDDILVKLDRASMAVALESRVPMLDHRVMEFAWSLPMALKRREGQTKWVLRQVLYRHVPRAMIDRPKKGFSVPIAAWLRGPLKEWAADLLDAKRLEAEGFLNPVMISTAWNEHVSGRVDRHNDLWSVLMFQQWLRRAADHRLV